MNRLNFSGLCVWVSVLRPRLNKSIEQAQLNVGHARHRSMIEINYQEYTPRSYFKYFLVYLSHSLLFWEFFRGLSISGILVGGKGEWVPFSPLDTTIR